MFDYSLALMSGVDIPIPELQTVMHQPTIKEISMVGEKDFLTGIQMLCIDKRMYAQGAIPATNFQLFMAFMNERQVADKKASVIQALSLLFPQAKAIFTPQSLILNFGEKTAMLDEGNFEAFQHLLNEVFCIQVESDALNPKGDKAKEIAEKLMKARQRVAAQKAKEGAKSLFSQQISILTIGCKSMSLNDCLNLTVYQLRDLIERYSLYTHWDIDIRSRLAGAKGDKPVEDWMKLIH